MTILHYYYVDMGQWQVVIAPNKIEALTQIGYSATKSLLRCVRPATQAEIESYRQQRPGVLEEFEAKPTITRGWVIQIAVRGGPTGSLSTRYLKANDYTADKAEADVVKAELAVEIISRLTASRAIESITMERQ